MKKFINVLNKTQEGAREKFRFYLSRRTAKTNRRKLVKLKNKTIVDNKLLKKIKGYAKEQFGSSSYWPWLALYTEIRGEFIPGWLPEDYYRLKLLKKYNPEDASLISGYKSLDSLIFKDFTYPILMYCISGNIYDGNRSKISINEASQILKSFKKEVVVKPELGRGGEGITFTKSINIDLSSLSKSGDFIIQPVCKQHSELQKLNPNSLNTLRVFTELDNNGDSIAKFYYIKFGVGNLRVDNASSGGGICGIHEDGYLYNYYYDGSYMKYAKTHPDTGIELDQIKVPNLQGIIEACKSAHLQYPYVKYIGWDVAVGVNEEPILIEWNARYPMLCFGEILFGPLWNKKPS